MFPLFRLLALALLAVAAGATHLAAQTVTATFNANLGGVAKLSLSSNSLSFPDANPDLFPQVQASTGTMTVTAKARANAGATVTLTVQAADDLRSGVDTIPATALTWTASGPGFVAGTVSRAAPQLVGSWSGSGVRTGTQLYQFQNSWNYASGTYTVALLYTLSTP
jgi:hypothetical protein